MIHFTDSVEAITADHLHGFFVNWPHPPSPTTHLQLLHNSDEVVLAIDTETGHVVGFITAISDRTLSAYIPLLEVLPAYQHQGIGKMLIEKMLHKLQHLYRVDLLCDSEMQSFYSQLGMMTATGMMQGHYDNQSEISV